MNTTRHPIIRSLLTAWLLMGAAACQGEVALDAAPGSGTPDEASTGSRGGAEPSNPAPGAPGTVDPDAGESRGVALPGEPGEPQTPVPQITADETSYYLRSISQMVVGRPLSAEELQSVEASGPAAIEPILRAWAREEGFAQMARYLIQQKLRASGQRDDIDFELPGNLAAHVARNDLPVSTLLTADYCIGADGEQTDCDSGAPFDAGVLTTRAFLAGNVSRFNLGRASSMLGSFACRHYPMEATLQPRLPKSALIEMFRAETAEEQTVEAAKDDAFGNGSACYTCHGQFGVHAQFFVKFDETGRWIADAEGQQDPGGELGRSFDGLMTSHMAAPGAAASEASQMFGQEAANLAAAARILAESEVFVPCMVRNLIEHAFGLGETGAGTISPELLKAVSERAKLHRAQPSFVDLVVEIFSDPTLVRVVLDARGVVP